MSFRNCEHLRKMSPAQEEPGRNTRQRRGVILPRPEPLAVPPRQAWGRAVTYIEEESRDWCEALYMNQAQTVREMSFPGSNVKKPKKKEIRKLNQSVSQGIACCFLTKAALILLLVCCKSCCLLKWL